MRPIDAELLRKQIETSTLDLPYRTTRDVVVGHIVHEIDTCPTISQKKEEPKETLQPPTKSKPTGTKRYAGK